jgi:hypothetical protein
MLTEQILIDQISVDENKNVHVRQATKVLRDGQEIAKTYHRWVLHPGDDVSQQDATVQTICNALWDKQEQAVTVDESTEVG